VDNYDLIYPTGTQEAVERWNNFARYAEELRVELKAAQAQAFLTPPSAEGQRVTDGQREAYATVQTADLAKRAAVAAVEAEVAERWAEFVLAKAEKAWDASYDAAVQARDWQTCELLLEEKEAGNE